MEGWRALADALDAGVVPLLIVLREDVSSVRLPALPPEVVVRRLTTTIFDNLAQTQHPQGVLAVVPIPDIPPAQSDTPLTLVVDGVRDPGNLGTLLRSAAAAGVDQVLLTPETVDPFNPKAVRAGMGAQLRVAISFVDADELGAIMRERHIVALADAGGEVPYDAVSWGRAAALIVGGEAFGPSSIGMEVATVRIRVPLHAGMESLNAGVAGSVVLFEAARQRRLAAEVSTGP